MTIPGGFVAGDVLGAADMNLLPAGIEGGGYAQVTADQTGIQSTTDLTSLTVTWTAVSTRRYRTSFQVALDINWTTGIMQPVIKIADGSNNVKQTINLSEYTRDVLGESVSGSIVETGLSGSVTRKLRLEAGTASADTVDLEASSTQPAYIVVEDIGPA